MRFYHGWDRYQKLLVEAIAPMSEEQLALRAAPSLRPVWTLAAHIISARVGWFHGLMGEAPDRSDFDEMYDWDLDDQPQRSAAELVHGLNDSWQMIADCLERCTSEDLDQVFTASWSDEKFSRQWVIWHVIEHDLHHGGELFFTLGMNGLPTPEV